MSNDNDRAQAGRDFDRQIADEYKRMHPEKGSQHYRSDEAPSRGEWDTPEYRRQEAENTRKFFEYWDNRSKDWGYKK
jgi:hypothetical protein